MKATQVKQQPIVITRKRDAYSQLRLTKHIFKAQPAIHTTQCLLLPKEEYCCNVATD